MPRKTATKTAVSPKNGSEIPLGAHPGNTGGKPGRSGRRPHEITLAAQKVFDKYRLLEIAAGIAVGRIEEEWYDDEGAVHAEPTKNADRLAAIRFIAGYAFGSPSQRIEHTGEDGGPIEFIADARDTFQGRMDRLIERVGPSRLSGLTN